MYNTLEHEPILSPSVGLFRRRLRACAALGVHGRWDVAELRGIGLVHEDGVVGGDLLRLLGRRGLFGVGVHPHDALAVLEVEPGVLEALCPPDEDVARERVRGGVDEQAERAHGLERGEQRARAQREERVKVRLRVARAAWVQPRDAHAAQADAAQRGVWRGEDGVGRGGGCGFGFGCGHGTARRGERGGGSEGVFAAVEDEGVEGGADAGAEEGGEGDGGGFVGEGGEGEELEGVDAGAVGGEEGGEGGEDGGGVVRAEGGGVEHEAAEAREREGGGEAEEGGACGDEQVRDGGEGRRGRGGAGGGDALGVGKVEPADVEHAEGVEAREEGGGEEGELAVGHVGLLPVERADGVAEVAGEHAHEVGGEGALPDAAEDVEIGEHGQDGCDGVPEVGRLGCAGAGVDLEVADPAGVSPWGVAVRGDDAGSLLVAGEEGLDEEDSAAAAADDDVLVEKLSGEGAPGTADEDEGALCGHGGDGGVDTPGEIGGALGGKGVAGAETADAGDVGGIAEDLEPEFLGEAGVVCAGRTRGWG